MSEPAIDTSKSEISDLYWQEVNCLKAVSGDEFTKGVMDFAINVSQPNVLLLDKSYFMAQITLNGYNSAAVPPGPGSRPPLLIEGIALAEDFPNALFASAELNINGQTVDKLVNYLPQLSMLLHRTSKPTTFMKTVGRDSMYLGMNRTDRLAKTSITGLEATNTDPTLKGTAIKAKTALDYTEEIIRPITITGAYSDGTIKLTAATGLIEVAGGAAPALGDKLIVQGAEYTVSPDATHVSPSPIANIATTADWYIIRRNYLRSSQAKNALTVLFRLPIGFMNSETLGPLTGAEVRFRLTPNTQYGLSAIEREDGGSGFVYGKNAKLTIDNLKFYAALGKTQFITNGIHQIDTFDYNMQSKPISGPTANLNFTVSPSSQMFYVFLQTSDAGTAHNFVPSRFIVSSTGIELSVTKLQLTYANRTLPPSAYDGQFSTQVATTNSYARLQQYYYDYLLQNGTEKSAMESFNEWLDRGPIYCFNMNKSYLDKSTEVQLNISLSTTDPTGVAINWQTAKVQVFLVNVFSKSTELTYKNSNVVMVRQLLV